MLRSAYPLLALSLLAPQASLAAGKLTSLDVQGDIVYFSTSETKVVASPACVAEQNKPLYSLSLATESGKAMYALLMTSMASEQALNVTSALDCSVAEGFEAVAGVAVAIDPGASVVAEAPPYSEIKATNTRTTGRVNSGSSSSESSIQRYEEFINNNGCPLNQGWRACFDEDIAYGLKNGDLTSGKIGAHHSYPMLYHSSKVSHDETMTGVSSNCKGFADSNAYAHAIRFYPNYPVVLKCNTPSHLACCKD